MTAQQVWRVSGTRGPLTWALTWALTLGQRPAEGHRPAEGSWGVFHSAHFMQFPPIIPPTAASPGCWYSPKIISTNVPFPHIIDHNRFDIGKGMWVLVPSAVLNFRFRVYQFNAGEWYCLPNDVDCRFSLVHVPSVNGELLPYHGCRFLYFFQCSTYFYRVCFFSNESLYIQNAWFMHHLITSHSELIFWLTYQTMIFRRCHKLSWELVWYTWHLRGWMLVTPDRYPLFALVYLMLIWARAYLKYFAHLSYYQVS